PRLPCGARLRPRRGRAPWPCSPRSSFWWWRSRCWRAAWDRSRGGPFANGTHDFDFHGHAVDFGWQRALVLHRRGKIDLDAVLIADPRQADADDVAEFREHLARARLGRARPLERSIAHPA